MRFLFVMDPYAGMLPTKDTSFALMRAGMARGHESVHCLPREVFNDGQNMGCVGRPLTVSDSAPHVVAGDTKTYRMEDFDAVLIRKDPPFDSAYLHLTHQLELLRGRVLVVNDPRALRDANEKLYAFHFSQYTPRTLVSANPEQLLGFVGEVGGQAVIKPLDGAGGSGVATLSLGDRNARAIIDLLTSEGRNLALVQEYQPDVINGDKRVLLLNGEHLGSIRRVPRKDDFRANIHVGGSVVGTDLTDAESALVKDVGARLRAAGLYFVGLDLIGGKLIEINVTSPTGIQELKRLSGGDPEGRVVEWLETESPKHRNG